MTRRGLAGLLALSLAAAPALVHSQSAPAAGLAPAQAAPDKLRAVMEAPGAREAIARVAYAEAAGQGDSGLAGVVYTILNRARAGGWGASIDQVVNAPRQFEPVMRVGGDWRALPAVTSAQRARIDTMLNLALDGRLPDLTGGALYFQNPRVVAARAAAGAVGPGLVNFGGSAPSAVIGDHAFYAQIGMTAPRPRGPSALALAGGPIFVSPPPPVEPGEGTIIGDPPAPGERGLFVREDGAIVEDHP